MNQQAFAGAEIERLLVKVLAPWVVVTVGEEEEEAYSATIWMRGARQSG